MVVDSDGMPLDNDRVAVQIVESLLEEDVPSEWMFSMRAWHIRRMFLNGVSLYDQYQ
jgi:ABC-type transporter MlaC component